MAKPRRALVRRTHQQAAAARRAPLSPRAQRRHPRLDRNLEREPTPLRVDQAGRADSRLNRQILPTNQPNGTLVTVAVFKALERWATPLVVRYRPQGVIDPSTAGFELGHGDHGGAGGGC